MKPTDTHMKIKCSCSYWCSIQDPQEWEIWVCSIWSALQTSGVCNIWRLLHIHKTFSVGRTEVIITGFGKKVWCIEASSAPGVLWKGSASWKEESSTTYKRTKLLWKCFKLFTALRVHPKVTHESQSNVLLINLAPLGNSSPLDKQSQAQATPVLWNRTTADLGSQHIAQPFQHKINQVFSKHFNLLEFLCRKARLQLLLSGSSLQSDPCLQGGVGAAGLWICAKLYPIFCLGLS